MFIDEIKSKFPEELVSDYAFTVFGNSLFVASGVKSVSYLSGDEIRLRCARKTLAVKGFELSLSEVGQEEVVLKGKITGVEIV